MDYQNAEFYKLNKNNPDLVYNFADETITYRKEEDSSGQVHIVEYRRKEGKKGTVRRIVPPYEIKVEEFDIWKARLTEEALEYRRHDDLTTRQNISIENLLDTDLVSIESVEEEYIHAEDEKQVLLKEQSVMNEILKALTETQRRRYYKTHALNMSSHKIAQEEGCSHMSVLECLEAADKKIQKELKRRGYIE